MLIKRKNFLQFSSLATASLMMPKFLKAFDQPPVPGNGNKVLVILQLGGGNDGLNTVIPVSNDIYYKSRPLLSIKKKAALTLSEDAGLHPALTAFKELYDDGSLAIINSVGYPNPDRSHFRSMDIWQSGSKASEIINTGWIGRYLDAQCNGCGQPTQALEIDDMLSLALKGEKEKGLAFKDPKKLFNESNKPFYRSLIAGDHPHEEPVDYLYKTLSSTISSAGYILDKTKVTPTKTIFPQTQLGRSFKTISSLINSDINTRVYYLSHGSFDTHVNQPAQQQRLFKEMNDAIAAFTRELKMHNRFNDVVLMTFSEFGRRVAQNAANGTDHGTANNMFMIGGGLKQKGLINQMPDLSNLNDGDLQYQTDFKQVYATLLDNWLDVKHETILAGKYKKLNFI